MPEVTTWLLEGPAYIQYRARLDLLGQSPQDAPVRAARAAMLAEPPLQALLAELAGWPWPVINSHKSAGHPLHKLVFIADLGLTIEDQPVQNIANLILEQAASNGPFQVLMNIPTHFGGSGRDEWAWALCDSPSLLYALIKFGLGEHERVQKALAHLAGLVRQNGWPCAGNLGKFRGPGRKEDPCPYANLLMLKALALSPGAEVHAYEGLSLADRQPIAVFRSVFPGARFPETLEVRVGDAEVPVDESESPVALT